MMKFKILLFANETKRFLKIERNTQINGGTLSHFQNKTEEPQKERDWPCEVSTAGQL